MRQYHIGVIAPLGLPDPLNRYEAAQSVVKALALRGYRTTLFSISRNLAAELKGSRVEVAFIVADLPGEEGSLAGLLETMGIAYTGPKVLHAALAGDKVRTKEILRLNNLPIAPYYAMKCDQTALLENLIDSLGFPVVVKPAHGRASLGVSVASNPQELEAAVWAAGNFSKTVIIERFAEGIEVTVGFLDNRPLGAVEIERQGGERHLHFPARLRPTLYRGILTMASRAVEVMGVEGAATVDLMVSGDENEHILEINSPPDLSERSLIAHIARGAGLGYEDLVERVLYSAEPRATAAQAEEPIEAIQDKPGEAPIL